jgi:6-phosphofructokinase 1
MGRDAGWLTAASALARQSDDEGPHLIYLPETDFNEDAFIADVDRVYTKLGRCIIAASEGIRYKAGDKKSLLAEKIMQGGEVDAHGNRQLSGSGALADYLTNLIKDKLGAAKPGTKLRVRGDTFGYLQRSFPTIVSPVDAAEGREWGRKAVQYAFNPQGGLTSGSVAIRRTSETPYKTEFFPTALTNVARQTKPFPAEWIVNGNNVSDAFIKYVTPLAGDLPRTGRLF